MYLLANRGNYRRSLPKSEIACEAIWSCDLLSLNQVFLMMTIADTSLPVYINRIRNSYQQNVATGQQSEWPSASMLGTKRRRLTSSAMQGSMNWNIIPGFDF